MPEASEFRVGEEDEPLSPFAETEVGFGDPHTRRSNALHHCNVGHVVVQEHRYSDIGIGVGGQVVRGLDPGQFGNEGACIGYTTTQPNSHISAFQLA